MTTGTYVDESDMTFSDYLDYRYENYVELNCKDSTKRNYKSGIEIHIKPELGSNRMCNLTPALLQDYLNNKFKEVNTKSLFIIITTIINSALEFAVNPLQIIVITIGDTLTKILKEHKIYQKEMKLKLGEFYHDKDYPIANLVCTKKWQFTRNTTISSKLGITVKNKLGFEFNFHMLRHTHASMLIQNRITPKDVQKRLGHANINIILNTYTHTTEESQRKVADLFDKL